MLENTNSKEEHIAEKLQKLGQGCLFKLKWYGKRIEERITAESEDFSKENECADAFKR